MAAILTTPTMTIRNQHHHLCHEVDNFSSESWQPSQSPATTSDSVSTPGDLVSLAWLQKGDIIQIAPLDGEDEGQSNSQNLKLSFPPNGAEQYTNFTGNFVKDGGADTPVFSPNPASRQPTFSLSSTDSRNLVPNPELFTHSLHPVTNHRGLSKPNYSYTHLIFMAIESTPQKCMTVNQIYNWCESNFPFYKHAGAGWKNSLRHNLSINKSFKRLPRDNRPEDTIDCRNHSLFFYSQLDDMDCDDEGPGRGAFWTVEPRERPALLDAIRRNPWSLTSLLPGQTDGHVQSPMSFAELCRAQLLGLRRFGLTQSAPASLLRAKGLGKTGLIDLNTDSLGNIIPTYYPGIGFIPTVGGTFVASSNDHSLGFSTEIADYSCVTVDQPISSNLELTQREQDYHPSLRERINVPNEWSAEEEEKYCSMLRSLEQSQDSPGAPLKEDGGVNSHLSDTVSGRDSASNVERKLAGTKQRRKSRLQPTRTTSCSECKENALSGCESCQVKSLSYDRNGGSDTFDGRVVLDVANALDSDQEHGPAGGPAVRKPNPRPIAKSSPNHTKASQEVYVTPAPYIDHEYSHCQAQLRGPEDNRMVNRYNEAYFMTAVQRFNRYRLNVKRRVRGRGSRGHMSHSGSSGSHPVGSESPLSDSRKSWAEDEEMMVDDPMDSTGTSSIMSQSVAKHPRKRGRYKRLRGVSRRGANHVAAAERTWHPVPSRRLSVRGDSRRSKRVVRAPRRLYDDSASVHDGDSFTDLQPQTVTGLNGRSSPKSTKLFGLRHSARAGRRGRRGRRRGVSSRGRIYRSRPVHSESDQDYLSGSTDDDDDDEEARCLLLAYERHKLQYYRNEDGEDEISPVSNRLSSEGSPRPFNLGTVWGQSRMALAQQERSQQWGAKAWEALSGDEVEADCMSDVDEVVGEISGSRNLTNGRTNDSASLKAADLLAGISQIERFRRQSGYVSLDSSEASIEAPDTSPTEN